MTGIFGDSIEALGSVESFKIEEVIAAVIYVTIKYRFLPWYAVERAVTD